MKIIVDKLPENPLECVFSRINTGTRRCAHNAKICPLIRGEECPFLTVAETPSIDPEMIATLFEKRIRITETGAEIETVIGVPTPEPKKRTTKRSAAKKAE